MREHKIIINQIFLMLEDEDYGVKEYSIKALGIIANKYNGEEIINKLLCVMKKERDLIRESMEVLVEIAHLGNVKEIINKIIPILKDDRPWIKKSVLLALGALYKLMGEEK